MEEAAEFIVGAFVAVIVSQIPMHLDDPVGGGAGDGLQAVASQRGEFDAVSPIRFRQLRAKRRAKIRIEMGGRQTELAKVAHHEWRDWIDNGLVAICSRLKTQIAGDDLRRGGIAFLQSDGIRAAQPNDLNAIAQTTAAIHPDVERHHLQLCDRRASWPGERKSKRQREQAAALFLNPGPRRGEG